MRQTPVDLLQLVAGLTTMKAVSVNHCYDAVGLVLMHSDGWKLVYSKNGHVERCKKQATCVV